MFLVSSSVSSFHFFCPAPLRLWHQPFIKGCNIHHTIGPIFLRASLSTPPSFDSPFFLHTYIPTHTPSHTHTHHTHSHTAWQELHLKEMRGAGEQLDSAGDFFNVNSSPMQRCFPLEKSQSQI